MIVNGQAYKDVEHSQLAKHDATIDLTAPVFRA